MTERFNNVIEYALFTYDAPNNKWFCSTYNVRPSGHFCTGSITKGFYIEMGKPVSLDSLKNLNAEDRKQLKESFGKMFL